MILQTGNRTDIPAFYPKWLYNRIKAGFVYARNPYFPKLVTSFSLDPSLIDLLVFCTKNPRPLFPYMEAMEKFNLFFFVSITPYGRDLEPYVPDKKEVIKTFQELSDKIGKKNVNWRYDPIIVDKKYTLEYHLRAFESIASFLEGYTDRVITSFVEIYPKLSKRYPDLKEVSSSDQFFLVDNLYQIARKHGMRLIICSVKQDFSSLGVEQNNCMDIKLFEHVLGEEIEIDKVEKKRKGCNCIFGSDIGEYSSCLHLCRYCYANGNDEEVKKKHDDHDPNSPLLIGHLKEDDILKPAKQASYRKGQMHFF